MPGPPLPSGYGPPSQDGKTNGMAIAAFVTGLLGCFGVLGLILGIVALRQIGDRGGKGRGLAIAGIILSCLWLVCGGVGYALRAGGDSGSTSSGDAGKSPSVTQTKPKKVDVTKMKVGDCINDNKGTSTTATGAPVEVETVKIVPCGGPHDGEVLAVFKLPNDMLPSENQLSQLASAGCKQRTQGKISRDPAANSLATSYYYPTLESWTSGERDVTCVAVSATDGKKLTRPIRG
ncbi:DUF4190 domain-containing protein [Actinomadura sp. 9N215]|uniref:DUF4190 domain-containing protein n=1 Tax=Actinomadura sp. 9N215 TaxID=3375150 RepID=UPI00378F65DA